MKKPSLQDIVLRKTLPNPKQNDPTSFFAHVQRNLVPEVRHEVQVFYGSLDCLEAQYPGLDYTYDPHRRRLARYPWHRRLFRTFDELNLTAYEILSLCQWEGTRSAKERYEAETKRKIIDTTADDIAPALPSGGPRGRSYQWTEPRPVVSPAKIAQFAQMDADTEADISDDDELTSSIGVQLNQQLQAAVEARSRGEQATVDAQWEQWMKEALERNEFDRDSILQAIREGRPLQQMSSAVNFEDERPSAGRSGMTSGSGGAVLSSLYGRSSTDSELAAIPQLHPQINNRYNDLRSMLSDLQSANDQLAIDNAQLAMLLTRSQPETAR